MTINKDDVIPVGKRLLIEPFKQASETTSGLAMAEGDGNATPVCGTVIRVGQGCSFKEGDLLLFRRYSIDSLKAYTEEGEQEIYLLEESEIIGTIASGSVAPPQRTGNYSQIAMKQNADEETTGSEVEEGPSQSSS